MKIKWIGEFLFIIFILFPLGYITISLWKREYHDND